MKIKTNWQAMAIVAVLVVLGACENQVAVNPKVATDAARKAELVNLSEVLRKVAWEVEAKKELMVAIASGYYEDEQVELNDLLSFSTAAIYRDDRFVKLAAATKVTPGSFARSWRKFYSDGTQQGRTDGITVNSDVVIYFPYSDAFVSTAAVTTSNVTVVPATVDANSVEVVGPDGELVVVNDAYASQNPVLIVQPGEATIAETGVIPSPATVFVGYVRCVKQYDALISFTGNGGGSEIMIGRSSGYLSYNSNMQITNFEGDLIQVAFKRSEISNNSWRRLYSIWDHNWEPEVSSQLLSIWEDDTKGTKKFDVSFETNVKTPKGDFKMSVKFSNEVSTQDDIIRQLEVDRLALFTNGKKNMNFGFKDFWPIYDGGGNVSFTLPF